MGDRRDRTGIEGTVGRDIHKYKYWLAPVLQKGPPNVDSRIATTDDFGLPTSCVNKCLRYCVGGTDGVRALLCFITHFKVLGLAW
jgi:hypothetical protein